MRAEYSNEVIYKYALTGIVSTDLDDDSIGYIIFVYEIFRRDYLKY